MIHSFGAVIKVWCLCCISLLLFSECTGGGAGSLATNNTKSDTSAKIIPYSLGAVVNTGHTSPAALITFARSLTGTPYLYASSDPVKGFDCSGFITYVFNHFNIAVPRSSVDFTSVGTEVPQVNAKPGDLILFTGTNSSIRTVGHMGIIVSTNKDNVAFIHSTSGKAYGVTESNLYPNYLPRLVKIIRIFR